MCFFLAKVSCVLSGTGVRSFVGLLAMNYKLYFVFSETDWHPTLTARDHNTVVLLYRTVLSTDQGEQGLCWSEQHQTASSQTGGGGNPHYT